jgi:hypothetical protein
MRLFHRTSILPADALALADEHFAALGMRGVADGPRTRTYTGPLGTLRLQARSEAGHYTFIEAVTDQIGESRLDKNVKKLFNRIHRAADPGHVPTAGY